MVIREHASVWFINKWASKFGLANANGMAKFSKVLFLVKIKWEKVFPFVSLLEIYVSLNFCFEINESSIPPNFMGFIMFHNA